MTDLLLADVSRYQGAVDWAAYAKWSQAAICKATQGISGVDRQFRANQAGMRTHLAVRGFYHFLTHDDPVLQARRFANETGFLRAGEFAVLDVEQDSEHARHEAFCAEVDALLGGVCWLYGGTQVRTSRPVWVARYRDYTPAPAGEPPIPHVLWQYTDRGRCPGISGNVDLNVHRGDVASLARFAKQQEDDVALTDAEVDRIAAATRDLVRADLYRAVQFLAGEPNATFDASRVGAPPPSAGGATGSSADQIADAVVTRLAARLGNG